MICHIYVETSLHWPKVGDGIVGIVFTDDHDGYKKPLFGQVRNVSEHEAVLTGVNIALKYAEKFDEIHLHLTSRVGYSFKYLERWQENGFKNAKGQEVKHAAVWKEIAEKIKGKKLELHLNEFNGYYKWLQNECSMRGRKHGFIL